MKRFAPLYLTYYASNIFIFVVADWFHLNATKFNFVAAEIIENVLVNDLHPTKKHPLYQFFPGLINKTNLLDPLPSNLEDQVPKIFKDHKISAVKPIDMVHTTVNTVICFDSEMHRQWHFDKLVFYMFIVTIAVPWSLNSHSHICDWWPVAASTFLKSVVILDYCPELLKTIVVE